LNSGHRLCFFGELLKAPIQPPLVVCSVLQNHTCESGEIRRRRREYFYHSPLISFICWIVELRIRCNGISSPGLAHIKNATAKAWHQAPVQAMFAMTRLRNYAILSYPFLLPFSIAPLLAKQSWQIGHLLPHCNAETRKKTRVFCYSTSYSLFISFKCDENCTNRGTKI